MTPPGKVNPEEVLSLPQKARRKDVWRAALVSLAAGCGLALWAVMARFGNQFGVLPTRRLAYALPLAAVAALPAFWLTLRWLLPAYRACPRPLKIQVNALALLGALLTCWLLPPALPDLPQAHSLSLAARGQPGEYSSGILVEVRQVKFLNGAPVPQASIQMTADWQETDGIYVSRGAPDSRLEISGSLPAGLAVYLRYQPEGGLLDVTWDGVTRQVDTFSRQGAILPLVLGGGFPGRLGLPAALGVGLLSVLYFGGALFSLWAALLGLQRLAGRRAGKALYLLTFAALLAAAIGLKMLYLQVDEPHAMRDSASYALTSEYPLISRQFWLGVRPFTVPLLLKAMHFTVADHWKIEALRPLARFQTLFSLVSWAALAFSLTLLVRRRWLKAALFGLLLGFSLSLQVGLWDAILLAESLSYSLLAWMLSGWVGLLVLLPRLRRGWMRRAWVGLTWLVTLLYCFARDSNVYFALVMAFILLAGVLLNRNLKNRRGVALAYTAGVLAIFIAQYASLAAGNRWQVFIYDHLAMRILKDPQATAYFVEKGMPLSDSLFKITEMPGFEYQPLLDQAAEFQPLRAWVACCSKQTYIQYLLSNPWRTLAEPFENWKPLADSSVQGYRNPKYGVLPLPRTLRQLSGFYFNQAGAVVLLFLGFNLCGLILYLRQPARSAWLLVFCLALAALPMMYFIWFAEPMEIDRHAAQIALQLRLAGWLSVPLLLEGALDGLAARRAKSAALRQA